MKTGMTDDAGYCMAVTAKRDGMRILAIVLGEKEGKVRNKETSELLDYGFNNYEVVTIKKKGDKVGDISIDKANPEKIDVTVDEDIKVIRKKGEKQKDYKSDFKLNNIKLPVKVGDVIGELLIKDNIDIIKKVDLKSGQEMTKRSFLELFGSVLKSMFTGDFT